MESEFRTLRATALYKHDYRMYLYLQRIICCFSAYNFIELFFSRRVLMSIIMGALVVGQLAAMSPDFRKGTIGAAHLLKLFSRVPPIDSFSDKGVRPVSIGDVCVN